MPRGLKRLLIVNGAEELHVLIVNMVLQSLPPTACGTNMQAVWEAG
jgi:hypothetical protein